MITFLFIFVCICTQKFSDTHLVSTQDAFFYLSRNWFWILTLNNILQRVTNVCLVQMRKYTTRENFSFHINIRFVSQFLLFTLVKRGTEILSWQFISAFCLTASKESRTGKASLPLICGSVPPPASLHDSDRGNTCFYSFRPLYHIVLLNLEMWH
jgi:hypothetical protein